MRRAVTGARHPAETILVERKCHATGTVVALMYSYEADPVQPWETVCTDHGGVCSHETRQVAKAWLSHPDEWCEYCMGNLEAGA